MLRSHYSLIIVYEKSKRKHERCSTQCLNKTGSRALGPRKSTWACLKNIFDIAKVHVAPKTVENILKLRLQGLHYFFNTAYK